MKNFKIKQTGPYEYTIEKMDKMRVPVKIFTNNTILQNIIEDGALEQGINVATYLPGIQKASILCPDAHKGYGFSIGGVASFDFEEGIITPGGIGFDINCGIRVLTTNLTYKDVFPKIELLLNTLYKNVPVGVGSHSKIKLNKKQLDEVLKEGAYWAYKNGYGEETDYLLTEESGYMKNANPDNVSKNAKKRGENQLGTLGAGNHFLEIQIVKEIYNKKIANIFGIFETDQIVVSIHCGSRGLGHQVCSDYLKIMESKFPQIMHSLPEKDLIYAPMQSDVGKQYFSAMASAANFAWANRLIIGHFIRQSFNEVFSNNIKLTTLYDVAHNIAKIEKYNIDGKEKKLIVHRKGATRSFPAGHPAVPDKYKSAGQPVLIPGSMGTASYILVGTPEALEKSFGSSAHGAGRQLSRHQALKKFRGDEIKKELLKHKIYIKAASKRGIAEESPDAYKDINQIIEITDKNDLAKKVVKLIPLGVIKG